MVGFDQHILVCDSCCGGKDAAGDGGALAAAFVDALRQRGLVSRVLVNRTDCLEVCGQRATVVIYPEGVWYEGVGEADVAAIVDEHVLAGRPVERLLVSDREEA